MDVTREFEANPVLHPLIQDPKNLAVDIEEFKEIWEGESEKATEYRHRLDIAEIQHYSALRMPSSCFIRLMELMQEQTDRYAGEAQLQKNQHTCQKGHVITEGNAYFCHEC